MSPQENKEIKFGWFGGVFTPSVLTIIGVVLFLRTGWLVGNSGLLGALIIIGIAHTVTIATGLSISSISTNIRIGAGGVYSIIARSLGLEIGGAIGIPLYLSQSISVAFYIAGFTEAWISLFPSHEPLRTVIALVTWFILTVISYIGAHWALRFQYLIMAAIAVSLISFFGGNYPVTEAPDLWGRFEAPSSFWVTFAIFFPAVTGIMSGVSMSGDLKNPKTALPLGTMLAILVGLVIYVGAAFAYAYKGTSGELVAESDIMVRTSLLGWTFYAGVFAATLSSALGTLVAAPRTLYALGEHGVVPLSGYFARSSATGQPRNAVLFTGIVSFGFVIAGTLDTIAQLLTMFFLITYGMVNLVTFIEQGTGIVSFRPSFRIPLFVPLYGAVACIVIMFIINPLAGLLSVMVVAGIYVALIRIGLRAKWGDVRSGLFSTIAAWAARQAVHLPRYDKSWTPDLLIPIEEPEESTILVNFARDICHPGGSVIAFSVTNEDHHKKLVELDKILEPIRKDKLFFISSVVEGVDFVEKAKTIIQLLRETFFRPNVLLITLSDSDEKDAKIHEMVEAAIDEHMGLAILKLHPKTSLGNRRVINLFLRDRSPNKNLAILLALQLKRNWGAFSLNTKINLVSLAGDEHDYSTQTEFFNRLIEEARMPLSTEVNPIFGKFPDDLDKIPECDLAIFGLAEKVTTEQIREIYRKCGVSCLFIRDSGFESAFA